MANQEKTIKELERISEWLFHLYQVVSDGDAPDFYDAYKTVDDAIELLRDGAKDVTNNGWVSVEDVLPGDCEMVMVKVYDDIYDTTWQFSGYYSQGTWYFSVTGKEIYTNWHPRYWLPIPEAPEVEE